MTDYQRTTHETRVVDSTDPAVVPARSATYERTDRVDVAGPGGATLAARIVTFIFGILQVALILRIILLALVANHGNDIVALILNATDPFVEPFRGMFALDRVQADRSMLDIAAIVALIGWTLIEALLLAAIRIFNRRPAEA